MGLIDAQEQSETMNLGGCRIYGPPMNRSIHNMVSLHAKHAYGGLFFRHLAVYAMINNPGVIEVVYLGKPRAGSSPI